MWVWWLCSTNPHDKYDCHYNVYAATVAEAEVDVLTGQSQLSRVDMLYDCGERYQNRLVTVFLTHGQPYRSVTVVPC